MKYKGINDTVSWSFWFWNFISFNAKWKKAIYGENLKMTMIPLRQNFDLTMVPWLSWPYMVENWK